MESWLRVTTDKASEGLQRKMAGKGLSELRRLVYITMSQFLLGLGFGAWGGGHRWVGGRVGVGDRRGGMGWVLRTSSRSSDWSSPWYPGTTGTPAADMAALAALLSPAQRAARGACDFFSKKASRAGHPLHKPWFRNRSQRQQACTPLQDKAHQRPEHHC